MRCFEVKLIGFLVFVAIFLSHDQMKTTMVAAQNWNCPQDMLGLQIECLIFMANNSAAPPIPNDRCCNVIKTVNIPCCCHHVTDPLTPHLPGGPPLIEDMLSWDRVMKVFKACGRPLAPGTKCGDFTVPPNLGF